MPVRMTVGERREDEVRAALPEVAGAGLGPGGLAADPSTPLIGKSTWVGIALICLIAAKAAFDALSFDPSKLSAAPATFKPLSESATKCNLGDVTSEKVRDAETAKALSRMVQAGPNDGPFIVECRWVEPGDTAMPCEVIYDPVRQTYTSRWYPGSGPAQHWTLTGISRADVAAMKDDTELIRKWRQRTGQSVHIEDDPVR